MNYHVELQPVLEFEICFRIRGKISLQDMHKNARKAYLIYSCVTNTIFLSSRHMDCTQHISRNPVTYIDNMYYENGINMMVLFIRLITTESNLCT